MGELLKLGGAVAALGILIGFGAVAWIEPTTGAGQTLLIIICALTTIVVGSFIKWMRSRKSGAADSTPPPAGSDSK
jgi:hypothetical protein